MSKHTGIEWTDHTFNPWWGCEKVSPACKHCYAETLAARFGTTWGATAPRRFFGDKHWAEPLAWNRAAEKAGLRPRVFCASMADVFEDRRDLDEHRARLWNLIEATPSLDWLLLTKRPESVDKLAPSLWLPGVRTGTGGAWPTNVWLGATVENQEQAEKRIPHLLSVPASVRFLSCEPLLGPLDLRSALHGLHTLHFDGCERQPHVDWVIAGGESGKDARAMHPVWLRSIQVQCLAARVPFFFKQWGDWVPFDHAPDSLLIELDSWDPDYVHRCGEVLSLDGRTSQLGVNKPHLELEAANEALMLRVGKKAAGSLLDERKWQAFPA